MGMYINGIALKLSQKLRSFFLDSENHVDVARLFREPPPGSNLLLGPENQRPLQPLEPQKGPVNMGM